MADNEDKPPQPAAGPTTVGSVSHILKGVLADVVATADDSYIEAVEIVRTATEADVGDLVEKEGHKIERSRDARVATMVGVEEAVHEGRKAVLSYDDKHYSALRGKGLLQTTEVPLRLDADVGAGVSKGSLAATLRPRSSGGGQNLDEPLIADVDSAAAAAHASLVQPAQLIADVQRQNLIRSGNLTVGSVAPDFARTAGDPHYLEPTPASNARVERTADRATATVGGYGAGFHATAPLFRSAAGLSATGSLATTVKAKELGHLKGEGRLEASGDDDDEDAGAREAERQRRRKSPRKAPTVTRRFTETSALEGGALAGLNTARSGTAPAGAGALTTTTTTAALVDDALVVSSAVNAAVPSILETSGLESTALASGWATASGKMPRKSTSHSSVVVASRKMGGPSGSSWTDKPGADLFDDAAAEEGGVSSFRPEEEEDYEDEKERAATRRQSGTATSLAAGGQIGPGKRTVRLAATSTERGEQAEDGVAGAENRQTLKTSPQRASAASAAFVAAGSAESKEKESAAELMRINGLTGTQGEGMAVSLAKARALAEARRYAGAGAGKGMTLEQVMEQEKVAKRMTNVQSYLRNPRFKKANDATLLTQGGNVGPRAPLGTTVAAAATTTSTRKDDADGASAAATAATLAASKMLPSAFLHSKGIPKPAKQKPVKKPLGVTAQLAQTFGPEAIAPTTALPDGAMIAAPDGSGDIAFLTVDQLQQQQPASSAPEAQAGPFSVKPGSVEWRSYEAGQSYAAVLTIRNVDGLSRHLRILPPKTRFFVLENASFPAAAPAVPLVAGTQPLTTAGSDQLQQSSALTAIKGSIEQLSDAAGAVPSAFGTKNSSRGPVVAQMLASATGPLQASTAAPLIAGLSASSQVAPGMAVKVVVRFKPSSTAPFSDVLTLVTESGTFTIPLSATLPSPELTLPLSLSAGTALPHDKNTSIIPVSNLGAKASFRLLPADTDAEPSVSASPAYVDEERDGLVVGPFSISPLTFTVSMDDPNPLDFAITFYPRGPGHFSREFSILCSNGDLVTHTVEGHAPAPQVGIASIGQARFLPALPWHPSAVEAVQAQAASSGSTAADREGDSDITIEGRAPADLAPLLTCRVLVPGDRAENNSVAAAMMLTKAASEGAQPLALTSPAEGERSAAEQQQSAVGSESSSSSVGPQASLASDLADALASLAALADGGTSALSKPAAEEQQPATDAIVVTADDAAALPSSASSAVNHSLFPSAHAASTAPSSGNAALVVDTASSSASSVRLLDFGACWPCADSTRTFTVANVTPVGLPFRWMLKRSADPQAADNALQWQETSALADSDHSAGASHDDSPFCIAPAEGVLAPSAETTFTVTFRPRPSLEAHSTDGSGQKKLVTDFAAAAFLQLLEIPVAAEALSKVKKEGRTKKIVKKRRLSKRAGAYVPGTDEGEGGQKSAASRMAASAKKQAMKRMQANTSALTTTGGASSPAASAFGSPARAARSRSMVAGAANADGAMPRARRLSPRQLQQSLSPRSKSAGAAGTTSGGGLRRASSRSPRNSISPQTLQRSKSLRGRSPSGSPSNSPNASVILPLETEDNGAAAAASQQPQEGEGDDAFFSAVLTAEPPAMPTQFGLVYSATGGTESLVVGARLDQLDSTTAAADKGSNKTQTPRTSRGGKGAAAEADESKEQDEAEALQDWRKNKRRRGATINSSSAASSPSFKGLPEPDEAGAGEGVTAGMSLLSQEDLEELDNEEMEEENEGEDGDDEEEEEEEEENEEDAEGKRDGERIADAWASHEQQEDHPAPLQIHAVDAVNASLNRTADEEQEQDLDAEIVRSVAVTCPIVLRGSSLPAVAALSPSGTVTMPRPLLPGQPSSVQVKLVNNGGAPLSFTLPKIAALASRNRTAVSIKVANEGIDGGLAGLTFPRVMPSVVGGDNSSADGYGSEMAAAPDPSALEIGSAVEAEGNSSFSSLSLSSQLVAGVVPAHGFVFLNLSAICLRPGDYGFLLPIRLYHGDLDESGLRRALSAPHGDANGSSGRGPMPLIAAVDDIAAGGESAIPSLALIDPGSSARSAAAAASLESLVVAASLSLELNVTVSHPRVRFSAAQLDLGLQSTASVVSVPITIVNESACPAPWMLNRVTNAGSGGAGSQQLGGGVAAAHTTDSSKDKKHEHGHDHHHRHHKNDTVPGPTALETSASQPWNEDAQDPLSVLAAPLQDHEAFTGPQPPTAPSAVGVGAGLSAANGSNAQPLSTPQHSADAAAIDIQPSCGVLPPFGSTTATLTIHTGLMPEQLLASVRCLSGAALGAALLSLSEGATTPDPSLAFAAMMMALHSPRGRDATSPSSSRSPSRSGSRGGVRIRGQPTTSPSSTTGGNSPRPGTSSRPNSRSASPAPGSNVTSRPGTGSALKRPGTSSSLSAFNGSPSAIKALVPSGFAAAPSLIDFAVGMGMMSHEDAFVLRSKHLSSLKAHMMAASLAAPSTTPAPSSISTAAPPPSARIFCFAAVPSPLREDAQVAATYLPIRADIQAPQVVLSVNRLGLGVAFVGVPVRRTLTITNVSSLPADYSIQPYVGVKAPQTGLAGDVKDKEEDKGKSGSRSGSTGRRSRGGPKLKTARYTLDFEPSLVGTLGPRESKELTLVLVPRRIGIVEDGLFAVDVRGMSYPLGCTLEVLIRGVTISLALVDDVRRKPLPLPGAPLNPAITLGLPSEEPSLTALAAPSSSASASASASASPVAAPASAVAEAAAAAVDGERKEQDAGEGQGTAAPAGAGPEGEEGKQSARPSLNGDELAKVTELAIPNAGAASNAAAGAVAAAAAGIMPLAVDELEDLDPDDQFAYSVQSLDPELQKDPAIQAMVESFVKARKAGGRLGRLPPVEFGHVPIGTRKTMTIRIFNVSGIPTDATVSASRFGAFGEGPADSDDDEAREAGGQTSPTRGRAQSAATLAKRNGRGRSADAGKGDASASSSSATGTPFTLLYAAADSLLSRARAAFSSDNNGNGGALKTNAPPGSAAAAIAAKRAKLARLAAAAEAGKAFKYGGMLAEALHAAQAVMHRSAAASARPSSSGSNSTRGESRSDHQQQGGGGAVSAFAGMGGAEDLSTWLSPQVVAQLVQALGGGGLLGAFGGTNGRSSSPTHVSTTFEGGEGGGRASGTMLMRGASGTKSAAGSTTRSGSGLLGRQQPQHLLHGTILSAAHESTQRFASLAGAEHVASKEVQKIMESSLSLGNGVAFEIWPKVVTLPPFGCAAVQVAVVGNMPGHYRDQLSVKIDGFGDVNVPLDAVITGNPLSILPGAPGLHVHGALGASNPTVVFGQQPVGGKIVYRSLSIQNVSPRDAHLVWHVLHDRCVVKEVHVQQESQQGTSSAIVAAATGTDKVASTANESPVPAATPVEGGSLVAPPGEKDAQEGSQVSGAGASESQLPAQGGGLSAPGSLLDSHAYSDGGAGDGSVPSSSLPSLILPPKPEDPATSIALRDTTKDRNPARPPPFELVPPVSSSHKAAPGTAAADVAHLGGHHEAHKGPIVIKVPAHGKTTITIAGQPLPLEASDVELYNGQYGWPSGRSDRANSDSLMWRGLAAADVVWTLPGEAPDPEEIALIAKPSTPKKKAKSRGRKSSKKGEGLTRSRSVSKSAAAFPDGLTPPASPGDGDEARKEEQDAQKAENERSHTPHRKLTFKKAAAAKEPANEKAADKADGSFAAHGEGGFDADSPGRDKRGAGGDLDAAPPGLRGHQRDVLHLSLALEPFEPKLTLDKRVLSDGHPYVRFKVWATVLDPFLLQQAANMAGAGGAGGGSSSGTRPSSPAVGSALAAIRSSTGSSSASADAAGAGAGQDVLTALGLVQKGSGADSTLKEVSLRNDSTTDLTFVVSLEGPFLLGSCVTNAPKHPITRIDLLQDKNDGTSKGADGTAAGSDSAVLGSLGSLFARGVLEAVQNQEAAAQAALFSGGATTTSTTSRGGGAFGGPSPLPPLTKRIFNLSPSSSIAVSVRYDPSAGQSLKENAASLFISKGVTIPPGALTATGNLPLPLARRGLPKSATAALASTLGATGAATLKAGATAGTGTGAAPALAGTTALFGETGLLSPTGGPLQQPHSSLLAKGGTAVLGATSSSLAITGAGTMMGAASSSIFSASQAIGATSTASSRLGATAAANSGVSGSDAEAGVVQSAIASSFLGLKGEHVGSLLLTFANGSQQRIGLLAEMLRPSILVSPSVLSFDAVHCAKGKTLTLHFSNPTTVPAHWSIKHVPAPVSKAGSAATKGAVTDWRKYGLQDLPFWANKPDRAPPTDEPSVFKFSALSGMVEGPTAPLEIAPTAQLRTSNGATTKPFAIEIAFKPTAAASYVSRFRVSVRQGESVEFVLAGLGSFAEELLGTTICIVRH